MFSRQYNFIFIHNTKAGGSSLQTIFLKYSDDKKIIIGPQDDGIERFSVKGQWTNRKHQPLKRYYALMPREIFEKQKIVVNFRHPVDRLISSYFSPHYMVKKAEKNWLQKTLNWLGPEKQFSRMEN